jgi:hypothetical protein
MSSESQPLVSPSTVPPSLPSTPIPWILADEEALIKRENAITHLQLCIARRDQCEIDLITFRRKYSETVINADPILHSRHILLINARKEAWEAYFKAYDALYPKTMEDILWIMAKAGHTQLVAPLMNLSKVTRTCIHLQPLMMNVKLGRRGKTQLHHCAENGLTTSVIRLLSIRNINVNLKDVSGFTPLHWAARNGHIEIARLLLQNGADVNANDNFGYTPLHLAAIFGRIDILRLLFENGVDLEAQKMMAREYCIWRPGMVTCLSFKNSYQDIMLISMQERIMGEQRLVLQDDTIAITITQMSVLSFKQMVVLMMILILTILMKSRRKKRKKTMLMNKTMLKYNQKRLT